MRLIDAGLLLDNLSGRLESMKDYDTVKDVVNNMQTAYDEEKVVDDLKDHAIEFETFGQCSDYVELSHAIEIVKDGVRTNDICKWKSASDGEFIQNPHTKRLYSNEQSMKNIYCNTCGKKIKAVE